MSSDQLVPRAYLASFIAAAAGDTPNAGESAEGSELSPSGECDANAGSAAEHGAPTGEQLHAVEAQAAGDAAALKADVIASLPLLGTEPAHPELPPTSDAPLMTDPDMVESDIDVPGVINQLTQETPGGWAGVIEQAEQLQKQAIADGFGMDKWTEVQADFGIQEQSMPWWWLIPSLRTEVLDYMYAGRGNAATVATATGAAESGPSAPAEALQDGPLAHAQVTEASFALSLAPLKALKGMVMVGGTMCSKMFGLALIGYLALQALQANRKAGVTVTQQPQYMNPPPGFAPRRPQPQPQLVSQSEYYSAQAG